MKKIFLFGYYGFQNTGDEAILEAIIKLIKKTTPSVGLTVLSYKAKETMEKYHVDAVSRNSFKDVVKAIRDSDVVISGGGSILQDVTSSRSLLYYSAIILLAKKMGKKVMFYGNGFGPITRYLNKKLVKHIINQVDVITVRDYQSKEYMQSLGIKREITVTADIAFALEIGDEENQNIFLQEKMDVTKKWVGISVRDWKGEKHFKEVIAKTADYLMSRNYGVVFIPMQFPSDVNTSKEIANMMQKVPKILEKQYNPREMIGMISNLDFLLGMRLHSLIFAAIAEVPMIGLVYDAKIKNFLKLVNQQNGGAVEDLDTIHLWAAIDTVIEYRGEFIERIKEVKKNLHKKVEMNIEIYHRFMQEGD